ncbi:MAG TPA: flagellar filament capping protein FliD [Ideonella sp.]|nr:flagellar filament capping protein FliD [Ideonella sp.]
MASVTSLGVGSGLDAEGIISSLMSVERRPLTLMQAEVTDYQAKLSSIGKLQSLTATMRDKAAAFTGPTLWGKTALTSSDSTAVSGTSTSATAAGNYAVTVQSLASAQTVTSAAFGSSSSLISGGTLTIDLGSYDGPPAASFTPKSGAAPITVTLGPGESTLAAIRDQINAAGAGVTATIINDASGARLSLRSAETGEENGFRIVATDDIDDGDPNTTALSALAFDATDANSPMALNQSAANARAEINGIEVESASNTLTDVSDGLTLTLNKVSLTPVDIKVTDDTAAVNTAITEFITAFNALASYIKDQTKYDPATKVGGTMQGDRTVIGFQSQLRGVINEGSTASSEWSRLSDIGITMNVDGNLTSDSTKLTAALGNPDELRKLLSNDGTTSTDSGFMDRFKDLGNDVLGIEGSLETSELSIQSRIDDNEDRQEQMETRLASTEARLRKQYEALDLVMANLSGTSSYVTQMINGLNNN